MGSSRRMSGQGCERHPAGAVHPVPGASGTVKGVHAQVTGVVGDNIQAKRRRTTRRRGRRGKKTEKTAMDRGRRSHLWQPLAAALLNAAPTAWPDQGSRLAQWRPASLAAHRASTSEAECATARASATEPGSPCRGSTKGGRGGGH
ncbi:unnamed protein product [Prorocentrum cordatum]|uniref:Uncharacterized protein n=1 Tax=Prorocentrum cordatum TaxID=2364126 RepID=A0ABN9Q6R5_9DINO|nr:unnamed protein product [Polarella glacialis]